MTRTTNHTSRRRGAAVAGFALTTLAGTLGATRTASADGPDAHEHNHFEFTESDFCGTGQAVDAQGDFLFNVWREPSGSTVAAIKSTINGSITWTNPATGQSVVEHWAGMDTTPIVEGDESGVHTHRVTEHGVRAKLMVPGYGVLTRDAGRLEYDLYFDELDNILGFEGISVSGPHPQALSIAAGDDLWCTTAIAALGL
jgi:hypothetical protein